MSNHPEVPLCRVLSLIALEIFIVAYILVRTTLVTWTPDPRPSSGQVEEFYNAGSWVAGLNFDAHGNLIALSHRLGLISISPEKEVTVLANKDEKGNDEPTRSDQYALKDCD